MPAIQATGTVERAAAVEMDAVLLSRSDRPVSDNSGTKDHAVELHTELTH